MLAHLIQAQTAEELDRIFDDARARHNEGLMVKDPKSVYTPGRRGLAWLKLKKALATLDVVVTGVEVGHGKRKHVLSDYTFAVYDERADRLVNIGKAYSGLTDVEIAQMTEYFKSITLKDYGRFRLVQPEVVLEVAFDAIMESGRHNSGFALRFPRIVRIRTDKTVRDIDTLTHVETLHRAFTGERVQLVESAQSQ
jgi:DNA ligase-1